VALLTNMAKHAGLPWDCILSAELAKHYKPDPETYQMAADLLGLRPDEVMMVAAHKNDLRAAQRIGLRAAFVPRPREHGPERTVDTTPDPAFDVHASDFIDLAKQLGV
jgi:2-haloacid dehalogenase